MKPRVSTHSVFRIMLFVTSRYARSDSACATTIGENKLFVTRNYTSALAIRRGSPALRGHRHEASVSRRPRPPS